jgi:hypothetical protein
MASIGRSQGPETDGADNGVEWVENPRSSERDAGAARGEPTDPQTVTTTSSASNLVPMPWNSHREPMARFS